ncbi:MAG: hypothetical protein EP329_00360 [Deltaproteobacteria bacterium]|nr:MAG: hypothetical protein EP329_00360 [Deltaproteobacteria bacterium]
MPSEEQADAVLVLDSGGVTFLARRSRDAAALLQVLRSRGHWPPIVPAVVLVECTQGHPGRDAHINRFLKTCDLVEIVPERLARRAAALRTKARKGSAVDAIVVAFAEPSGAVITSDPGDLKTLAAFADSVKIAAI